MLSVLVVLTSAALPLVIFFFLLFTAVGLFKLVAAFAQVVDTFALLVTCALSSSSESDATSLLSNCLKPSLAAFLEGDIAVANPLDVDGFAACPSSTKLMSSGPTCARIPRDQVGCLEIWILQTLR